MTDAGACKPVAGSSARRLRFSRRLQSVGVAPAPTRSIRPTHERSRAERMAAMQLLRNMPAWIGWEDDEKDKLAQAVAVLSCRSAIDMEISGPRLASFSDALGAEFFETLCEVELDEVDKTPLNQLLPRPDMLSNLGHRLLEAGLPRSATSFFANANSNAPAARLAAIAMPLVVRRAGEASQPEVLEA